MIWQRGERKCESCLSNGELAGCVFEFRPRRSVPPTSLERGWDMTCILLPEQKDLPNHLEVRIVAPLLRMQVWHITHDGSLCNETLLQKRNWMRERACWLCCLAAPIIYHMLNYMVSATSVWVSVSKIFTRRTKMSEINCDRVHRAAVERILHNKKKLIISKYCNMWIILKSALVRKVVIQKCKLIILYTHHQLNKAYLCWRYFLLLKYFNFSREEIYRGFLFFRHFDDA